MVQMAEVARPLRAKDEMVPSSSEICFVGSYGPDVSSPQRKRDTTPWSIKVENLGRAGVFKTEKQQM